jgi:hypothetical protein
MSSVGASVVVSALLLGPVPASVAQNLPPVTTERLSSSQQADVREYVQSRLETLQSGDASSPASSQARRELIDPMRNRDTSVAMRQAFAQAASEQLEAMVRSNDDQVAVSALLIAGNIADRASLVILETGLDDGREPVQIGAAAGAKAMLRATSGRLGGAQAERQERVQQLLADTLGLTKSGHVAQSLIGALTALPDDPAFMSVSGRLIAEAMAGQAGLRRRGVPVHEAEQRIADGWAGAMERAIAAQLAFQRSAAIAGLDIDRETQRQGVELAGIALSLVRDALDHRMANGESDEQVEAFMAEHNRLISAAETLLILVESNFTARTDRQQVMSGLIGRGDADGLIEAINVWVGERGVLTGAPFSFPASTFGN